ncbi:molybdopterin-dependent oxidoreductase [Sphingobium sufflavum]|uniref:xanthine dehydrogenase family protein molybdopterin-binding subunit n=1 Tax=Sphingobium sufflavum TaxID=1129547 RepID=UPI001F422BD7|nr:molybdopterin cofactor-binding domain-containing protein [Sphingobium sufflavum]MCE7797077.1 molybdopterin-dependent oxidoreductase [Sphingobium sufflavum]
MKGLLMQQDGAAGDLPLDRRRFLVSAAVVGGGMALGIGRGGAATGAGGKPVTGPWGPDAAQGSEFSPWIEIAPDDIVTIRVPQPEIGNGAMTQAAMTVTEELECDWAKVRVAFASIQRNHIEKGVYNVGFQGFFGGHSTEPDRMAHVLQLGASARERLKAAAAARWSVPVADISVKNSVLTHAGSGRTLRYGEVATEAARIVLPAEPARKPRSEWRLIGKSSPSKLNIPDIAHGRATYGIDVKLPGMVHAALMQSPVQGGKLKSHKPEAVLKMPGVRAVIVLDPAKTRGVPAGTKQAATFGFGDCQVQSAVAVIADHYWQARTALEALPVEWDAGSGAQWTDSAKIYAAASELRGKDGARTVKKAGDVATATGKRVVEGDYGTPYCENAMMEPLNATVLVTADGAEAWVPTQDQQQAYWTVIDETGLSPEKVKVHQTFVGGGFGRRTQADDVRMAVAIAKEFPGKPVKTIWTREETFRQGRYRTPITTQYKAVLDDATGLPQMIMGDVAYVGTRPSFMLPLGFSDQPYFNSGIIPNVRLTSANLPITILNGAWRAPCYNSHAFNLETFIDECAVAAGIDPLDYRLKLLAKWDKAWSDTLRVAAEKAGWGAKLPKGEGLGIAISCWPVANMHNNGSVIATVARVSVSQQGELRVRQVDVAFDCGSVANADAVRAQVEGGTMYGLNACLNEEMTVKDGAMVEGNFDEYPMMHMADAPVLNVHFEALSGHERMAIIGEAPTGPIQPAVGNAIFAATGKRLRRTPFRTQDLSWS